MPERGSSVRTRGAGFQVVAILLWEGVERMMWARSQFILLPARCSAEKWTKRSARNTADQHAYQKEGGGMESAWQALCLLPRKAIIGGRPIVCWLS